ncbi:MAG: hypothetical protein V4797_23715 [Paraburkholderia tropica]|nr:hypothetical protein [Paraburkholderia tropica]MDE1142905.1 hypothetical protein [Paraburkholderia tropica]
MAASLAAFLIVVGVAKGSDWRATVGRLLPLVVLAVVAFLYQVVKQRRILKGKPSLGRRQLFFRFYIATAILVFSYFGLCILWEVKRGGEEIFTLSAPILLICIALCAVALHSELRDLPDDFEGN